MAKVWCILLVTLGPTWDSEVVETVAEGIVVAEEHGLIIADFTDYAKVKGYQEVKGLTSVPAYMCTKGGANVR